MLKLNYVTSNAGKMGNIVRILAEHGFEVVQMMPGDMPEIQADTSAEVARAKAIWAFREHRLPVIVNDTAFHIPVLGGWPGPTLKYATQTLGYRNFCQLIASMPDATCLGYYEDTVAFFDRLMDEPMVFTRRIGGHVIDRPRGDNVPHPSFFMSRLFVPDGWTKTVAEMNADELAVYRHGTSLAEVYHRFGSWLEGHFAVAGQ